jgi:sulfide:quinone oxidoreductase
MGQASRPGSFGGLRVLIAGGGVAGLEATLALRELAGDLVDVELLSPEHHFWYRPLAVAEPFGVLHLHRFDLSEIASEVGAAFTPGALTAVESGRHVVYSSRGAELAYDVLVVACGTKAVPAIGGALTFRGPSDTERLQALLAELDTGTVKRLLFAVPDAVAWPLPLYELALLTAAHLDERGITDVELALVTPEPAPLARLGPSATGAIETLLADRGVRVHAGTLPDSLDADRIVALAHLEGQRIPGIPHDGHGFVATGPTGLVDGLEDVYAAGDITTFPVKQGGIAAQQADVVADAIAARAGADVEVSAFEPVVHALLLTGGEPLYLRAELGGEETDCTVSTEPLWWPPTKIAGRHLSPFLATQVAAELTR